ncbi:3192_t:CDS:2 [Dentiscutata heterogama]|uniref:3192_t:CDS:1 n=1 Tax=Dentiscutata heterogama TaxID=1316150 RepID=A0ACA9M7W2_9GLOM|nr:3192_t:CDS:2 [Dentiscutata heterogama]
MTENNNIELVLKQQDMIDLCLEYPIITYKIVKKLGFEKDKSLLNITDKVVSDIIKQVLDSETWDSARYYKLNSKSGYFSEKSYTI